MPWAMQQVEFFLTGMIISQLKEYFTVETLMQKSQRITNTSSVKEVSSQCIITKSSPAEEKRNINWLYLAAQKQHRKMVLHHYTKRLLASSSPAQENIKHYSAKRYVAPAFKQALNRILMETYHHISLKWKIVIIE